MKTFQISLVVAILVTCITGSPAYAASSIFLTSEKPAATKNSAGGKINTTKHQAERDETGGGVYKIEFFADAEVTALNFSIAITPNTTIDLTNCVAELPKSHIGACAQKGDKVNVVVFSISGTALPTGQIGSFTLPMGQARILSESVSMSDAQGNAMEAEAY